MQLLPGWKSRPGDGLELQGEHRALAFFQAVDADRPLMVFDYGSDDIEPQAQVWPRVLLSAVGDHGVEDLSLPVLNADLQMIGLVETDGIRLPVDHLVVADQEQGIEVIAANACKMSVMQRFVAVGFERQEQMILAEFAGFFRQLLATVCWPGTSLRFVVSATKLPIKPQG